MAKLPRRPLGTTGLEVSVLGYGGSPLGGVYEAGYDEAEGVRSMHAAFEAGINFFDTSPYYGITRSETVMGRAMPGLPRGEVVLATKVGRYGPDMKDFDFSAERVTRSVRESLERLQTPYIDLIQTHDIEFGDLDLVVNETIPALLKLKADGLVRHVGITGLPLKVFKHVLDRVPPGSVETVLSYCHYSMLDTTLASMVPYLQDKGVGVINASALAMGLLTPQGPPDWHPAPPEVKLACREAAAAASAQGVNLAKLGIMQALKYPDIATTLVGMPSRDQVASNVATALQALGLQESPDAAAEAAALREVESILKPVQDITWPSGRPENN